MHALNKSSDLCRNKLLATLPLAELDEMGSRLEIVEVEYGHKLTRRNEQIDYVYFPCDCIASIIVELESGQAVEIGAVGNEGMSSVMAFLGGKIAIDSMICQIPGTAVRMHIDDFRQSILEGMVFREVCQKYAQVYLSTACQAMACNRFHKVEQRLARWLLMSHDRVSQDEFPITQDYMAVMLGTERPSVTVAAKHLMDHGFIQYSRGRMNIQNRAGLESQACECYQFTRDQFRTILGIDIG